MLDIVLEGGTVHDGDAIVGLVDVGIRNGRIVILEPSEPRQTRESMDISGKLVAPGFIDVHTHSDAIPFLDSSSDVLAEAFLLQGVTTQVVGNCGFSAFPFLENAEAVERHLQGLLGRTAKSFGTIEEYRTAVDVARPPTNIATLVGHGSLRMAAMGPDRRPPSASELTSMRCALESAIEGGALGLSSGLTYVPGLHAVPSEIRDLCDVLPVESVYATHVRSETAGVAEAFREAVTLSELVNVPIHVSHMKSAARNSPVSAERLIALLEKGISRGGDLSGDFYPYAAASTMLVSLLPPWLSDLAGELRTKLGQSEVRRQIRSDIESGLPGWQNFVHAAGWENVTVAAAAGVVGVEGHSIRALAKQWGATEIDVVCELVIESNGSAIVVIHAMREEDIRTFAAWDRAVVGSDAIPLPGRPHPRLAGSFARVLRWSINGRFPFSLGTAIEKMTGRSADRFNLRDRGRIRDGLAADLVVLDVEQVDDLATYSEPLLPAKGVAAVLIGGEFAVRCGQVTSVNEGLFVES